MSLPFSRNATYSALSQVDSADLNDLQDKTIDEFLGTPIISPTALASDTDDYTPSGLDTARTIRQDLSASVTLTGLTGHSTLGHVDGRRILLVNVHASFTLSLAHEDAGSTTANRFSLPRGLTLVLKQHEYALLRYDGTAARWGLVATSGRSHRTFDVPLGAATESGSAMSFDGDGTLNLSRASAGSVECVIPISLEAGESIIGYTARVLDENDTTVTTELVTTIDNVRQGDAQSAPANTPQTSASSAAWQTLSHILAAPYSYPSGDVDVRQMYLLVTLTTSNTGSIKVGKVRVTLA